LKHCVLLPFLLLVVLLPGVSPAAADQGVSYLVASPSQGHSGDTFYLSGVNLEPNQQLYILMTCPLWSDPSVAKYHNEVLLAQPPNGPMTDAQGDFAGFKVKALQLSHLTHSGCYLYETAGGYSGYGPEIPGQYAILPGKLNRCATSICNTVLSSLPVSARAGSYERVSIHQGAWPGAKVDVTVSYHGLPLQHIRGSLDVRGNLTIRIRIPEQAGSRSLAHVWATLWLGRFRGTTKASAFRVQ